MSLTLHNWPLQKFLSKVSETEIKVNIKRPFMIHNMNITVIIMYLNKTRVPELGSIHFLAE